MSGQRVGDDRLSRVDSLWRMSAKQLKFAIWE